LGGRKPGENSKTKRKPADREGWGGALREGEAQNDYVIGEKLPTTRKKKNPKCKQGKKEEKKTRAKSEGKPRRAQGVL